MNDLDKAIAEEKAKVAELNNQPTFGFDAPKQNAVEQSTDRKEELINSAFEQATIAKLKNDEALRDRVSETAEKYVDTKMQVIATDVDTEHKKAFFKNRQSACESYGFEEETTPKWAVRLMSVGYSIMLAIWLIVGTFTFMPVIFIAKKISVGVKKTWLAIVLALLLYLFITVGVPFLTLIKK